MTDLILGPLRRSASDASSFAETAYQGQFDKAGQPYLFHVARTSDQADRLAEKARANRDVAEQVGWLHDIIEDTPYDGAHLRREGFSEEVVSAVEWLTKPKGENYAAWIKRLCAKAPLVALIVKLADLEDNLDPERLSRLDEPTQARLRSKYEPAREQVSGAVGERMKP